MPDARCITLDEAAEYCGLSPSGFQSWRERGLMPGPIPGTHRWDRRAIDVALDKLSGLANPPGAEASAELEEWLKEHAGAD